jgi:glycosyltransferase involved in cell wall biosynthesis
MSTVHFVVPDGFDQPANRSGGNVYDWTLSRGLTSLGWQVRLHSARGAWPWPDAIDVESLDALLAAIPDGAATIIDGLIASTVPSVFERHADRLPLVVLVHMPLGDGPIGHEVPQANTRERAVLSAAAAVITTSSWARERLLAEYALDPECLAVAEPGAEPGPLAAGTPAGGEFLCVGPVSAHKGHDVLVSALAQIADLPWRCICVGATSREPAFADQLIRRVAAAALTDRIRFDGPKTAAELEPYYAHADLLVHPARVESYGMVITEALAHGIPVVAAATGGVPESLGRASDGKRPGVLVRTGDASDLAAALRRWLREPQLRDGLRAAARDRRRDLNSWSTTAGRVADVLVKAGVPR